MGTTYSTLIGWNTVCTSDTYLRPTSCWLSTVRIKLIAWRCSSLQFTILWAIFGARAGKYFRTDRYKPSSARSYNRLWSSLCEQWKIWEHWKSGVFNVGLINIADNISDQHYWPTMIWHMIMYHCEAKHERNKSRVWVMRIHKYHCYILCKTYVWQKLQLHCLPFQDFTFEVIVTSN